MLRALGLCLCLTCWFAVGSVFDLARFCVPTRRSSFLLPGHMHTLCQQVGGHHRAPLAAAVASLGAFASYYYWPPCAGLTCGCTTTTHMLGWLGARLCGHLFLRLFAGLQWAWQQQQQLQRPAAVWPVCWLAGGATYVRMVRGPIRYKLMPNCSLPRP